MSSTRAPGRGRRRRRRRGSLERPVNSRLYRGAFLFLSLPLLILAFSITRPDALPAPLLPPIFDGPGTSALAAELATSFPSRVPGSNGDDRAATWFGNQMRQYGLPIASQTWHDHPVGLPRVQLENVWAVAAGRSPEAIVVTAHRDNSGVGPGANDDASGTAALVELARGYAESQAQPATARAAHTLVFLSTDAGAFGGLGALHFAEHLPFDVVAVVNLDAIAGAHPPRLVITGDAPRSPAATLVETAAKRVLEQSGTPIRRSGFLSQLIDLGFPLSLYEQGPFVARGIPAVTLTTAGDRPPAPFTDRVDQLDERRLGQLGRAVQELLSSLDQGLELAQGTTSFVWIGDRIIRGWALELVLAALLIPFAVAVVDLFAHCRRRRLPLLPALKSLRRRLGFWAFVGAGFYAFGWLGAWPTGAPRPPSPSARIAGDWPVLLLLVLAALSLVAWAIARTRLTPRRPVSDGERLAGETAALLTLAVVSLLVLATNPFALLFVLPAVHAWIWLPQVRAGHAPARAVVFLVGLIGPLLIVLSLAVRFGLGFDAPWYLLELVAIGYVHVTAVALTLAGAACAAQLVAVSAGRYAPYPSARRDYMPRILRAVIRSFLLLVVSRRRVTSERRRAFGG